MNRHIGFSLIVAGVAFWLCLSILAAPQDQQTSNADKLQELLTQRRDVLKSRFEWIKVLFEERRGVSLAEYVAAHNQLLMAELEFASEKQQRLLFLRQRVDNLRSLEIQAEAEVKLGRGSKGEKLLATANRIQAEIDYVREESKAD